MSNIDLAPFPVKKGEEPSHLHFESLRRRIWALWHVAAGAIPIDYTQTNSEATSNDGRGDTTGWAAYVDSFDWTNPWEPGEITAHVHLAEGESKGDLYVNWKEMNRAQADAYPPAEGIWWKKYPDPNKYHHFDRNADRWFVSYIARGPTGGDRSHRLVAEAWRWLPRHTDPKFQLPPVIYADTERVVYRYGNKVEVNRKHITQTFSLGAKYDAQTTSSSHGGPRVEPIYGEEVPGNQYVNFSGEPGDSADPITDILPRYTVDATNTSTNKHWLFEAKLCAAYQNAIEYFVSIGDWVLPVDSTYANNHEAYYNSKNVHTAPDWEGVTDWGLGETVRGSDDRFYTSIASPNIGNDPVGDAVNWDDVTVDWDPSAVQSQHQYALLVDKLWGCNEGAIEVLLKKINSFDWYYDRTHPWMWNDIIKARYDESLPGGGGGNEDTKYPSPDGTWRRTWKNGMGRLSTRMRAYEEGTPSGDAWIQTSPAATDWYEWPGIFNVSDPDPKKIDGSYSTTQAHENKLIARHDPVQINYDKDDNDKAYPQHEITAACINEMYAVLQLLRTRFATGLTLVMRSQLTVISAYSERDTPQLALDAHKEAATSASTDYDTWNVIGAGNWPWIGYAWEIQYVVGTGKYRLFSTTRRQRLAVQVVGGLSEGLYIANTLWWRVAHRNWYQDDIAVPPYAQFWDLDVGMPDEQVISFTHPSGSQPSPYYPTYSVVSLNMPTDYTGTSEWAELLMLDDWPTNVGYVTSPTDRNDYYRQGSFDFTSWSYGDVIIDIDWNKFPASVWEPTFTNIIEIAEEPIV